MIDDEPQKEFMLSALRVASARIKLMDNEILSVGVALRHDMIGPAMAVKWVHELGLMYLLEPMPGAVTAIAMAETTEAPRGK